MKKNMKIFRDSMLRKLKLTLGIEWKLIKRWKANTAAFSAERFYRYNRTVRLFFPSVFLAAPGVIKGRSQMIGFVRRRSYDANLLSVIRRNQFISSLFKRWQVINQAKKRRSSYLCEKGSISRDRNPFCMIMHDLRGPVPLPRITFTTPAVPGTKRANFASRLGQETRIPIGKTAITVVFG